MKIVIDTRELRSTTGRYQERLLFYLQQLDHDNDYIVLIKPADFDTWQPTNPRFNKVKCPYKEFTFSEQIGLLRQINNLKPDLVHFCMAQQPLLFRRPVVTTIQDLTMIHFRNPTKNWLIFTIKQWVYRFLSFYVPHKSRQIIVPSNYVKNVVAHYAHVNPEKITVTYEAADKLTEPAEPLSQLADKQFIMYVGRPQPHKNLDRLVEAFAGLYEKYPNLQLALVGKTDVLYERLKTRVKAMDGKNIIFTGFVTDGQLRWLYDHCELYVFPSLSEGFGLPGLEAMVAGAPVVSSNATCLPEIYGDAADYFDPYNVADISRALNDVLSNQQLRQKLIAAGSKRAAEFSWQKMAQQTLDIYRSVEKN
jgi:glycosyltransferase involved in cell wall biosynthesis